MAAIRTSIFLVLMMITITSTAAGDGDDVRCNSKPVGGEEETVLQAIIDDLVLKVPDRVDEGQRYCTDANWAGVHVYGTAACYLKPGGEPDIVSRCRSCLQDLGDALFANCSAIGAGAAAHPGYPSPPLCCFNVGTSSCHN